MACGGAWKQSQLFLNCRYQNSSKRKGVRKWMLRSEVISKFGEQSGQAIIDRKLADPELCEREVRKHPENPDDPALMQFLILDLEEQVDTEEELMEQLYSVAEDSSASYGSGGSSNKAKKKNKKATKDKKKKKKAKSNKARQENSIVAILKQQFQQALIAGQEDPERGYAEDRRGGET